MIRPVFTEIALFLRAVRVYALFLCGDARRRAAIPTSWPLAALSWLAIAALVLMIGSFVVLAAVLRRAAGLDLRAGAYRERRSSCPGTDAR